MSDTDSIARVKAAARTHYANAHSTGAAMADVSPNVIWHGPASSPPTFAGWKQRHERLVAAFGDMEFTVNSQIAENDMVMTHWTMKATHKGEFLGIPATGKRVVMTGIGIDRVSDGKVVEHWGMQDLMGLVGQLGGVPVAEAPRLA
jgi:predicted ester cyclase